jgi:hypothetical protein
VTNQILFRDLSKGYTLDGLDNVSSTLEGVPFSLDSRVWAGGLILLSGFDGSNKLVNYNGTALTAEIDTAESQLVPGKVAKVEALRPLVEGSSATVTVSMGTRDTLQSNRSFATAASLNSIGEADVRSTARYHTARIGISGGFEHAQGVQLDAAPWGRQ